MEISPSQRSSVPRLLELRRSSSIYQKSKKNLFLSAWSFNDYVCRLAFGLIAYFFYLFYVNDNTERGDQFRHRPDWLLPLEWLVPEFDLDPNWFLRGDEDETAKQGLLTVVDSLNKEARLNKLGKLLVTVLLNEQLEQRSCVAKEVAEHNQYKANASLVNKNGVAALLEEEKRSDPPIVVLGLPRTGTTFMHGMLGANPNFRVPRFFEYMHSCSPATKGYFSNLFLVPMSNFFSRKLQGMKMYWLRKLLPSLKSIHFIGTDSPEEDIIALGHEMVSMMLFTSFYVPSYVDWIKQGDQSTSQKLTDSLKYLKDFLDIHLRTDQKPWILKTPWHLAQIRELSNVFPGTRFVWLHRDIIDTLSSLVDLVISLIGIGSDLPQSEENRHTIAMYTIDLWFWALERGVTARNKLEQEGKIQFVDVSFDGLNQDALKVARTVFHEFGYTVEDDSKLKAFAKENARGKRGQHVHKLEFGLNADEIRARYESIMAKLKVWHFADDSAPPAASQK